MDNVPNTLYHYCSSEAFTAIVESKNLWLSALTLSNDSQEGKVVKATVMRLAERDNLSVAVRDRLQESLVFTERFFEGLGFCLSEHGDLLSQWRGYADDAKGVCIGFDRQMLEVLAESTKYQQTSGFALYKVAYKEHEKLVEPTYQELRKFIDAGALKWKGASSLLDARTAHEIAEDDLKIEKAHKALIFKLLEFMPRLYELKSPAFSEEHEWRLVSMLLATQDDGCLFRSANDRIVPYRAFSIASQANGIIREIILGPKHQTPVNVVQSLLKQAGFGPVEVRLSEASYR